MQPVNRRRFLQLGVGAAAASMLSPSIARAAAIPADRRTRSIKDVEHVVVLMQENRSFDHYFGTMRGVRGYGDPHPVTLPSGKSVFHQPNGSGEVLPFHPDTEEPGLAFLPGLNHDWDNGHHVINGGRYDQWIPNKSPNTMAYLTREDIPFHYALADAFTICDGYHCSLVGPTDPNRYYMWTGGTGNDGTGGGPVIDNDEKGYSWTTYPERLQQAGVSWKIYQDVGEGLDAKGYWGWTDDPYIGNYGDNSLLYFNQYRNAKPGEPLYDRARTGTDAKAGQDFFELLRADVTNGTLPQVSWVVAPEAFTEHPNWPANYGAWYIAQVLDALTSNPEVWSKTALFVTYDENDGFFDHVVPPYAPMTAQDGASTVDTELEIYRGQAGLPGATTGEPGAYGLGQRVPMFVVSPFSKGGYVCSEVFDHTSIIRFLERRFGVHEPNISPWRRAVCGDLTAAFDFASADDRVPDLPSTDAYLPPDGDRHPDAPTAPPAVQRLPKQEPGVRRARPLPYDLEAAAALGADGLTVSLTNRGTAGAVFHTRARTPGAADLTAKMFTVEAGRQLRATFPVPATGGYDVEVHGPNGFYRRFAAGTRTAGPEVSLRRAGQGDAVQVVVVNGGHPVEVTVVDAYGHGRPTTRRLRSGERIEYPVARDTHGWYDVRVTSGGDAGFVRALAGHVENGRSSVSDPALGR
ncbi:phosphocholine-specific phospholipase C [Micromonospora sp. NPDC049559]|uniref:phosphocholine-specific phospholipase C n=1 Tax=Micromonospora sp. NPDC049559 TaxID=3155923 RepID=UPI0034121883